MHKNFSRRTEDFTCELCGSIIKGNGYTNHCSNCLWSKHVDVNPGDRDADCKALMAPVSLIIKRDEYIITHKCTKCQHVRKNRSSPDDNMQRIIDISSGKYKYLDDPLYTKKNT